MLKNVFFHINFKNISNAQYTNKRVANKRVIIRNNTFRVHERAALTEQPASSCLYKIDISYVYREHPRDRNSTQVGIFV